MEHVLVENLNSGGHQFYQYQQNEQTPLSLRRVWRYQRGNQNQYIEKEQTTQWPKEKVQSDKQQSPKHTHKTKDRVTRIPLKTGGDLRCSRRVSSSCSTSDMTYDVPMSDPRLGHAKHVAMLNRLMAPQPSPLDNWIPTGMHISRSHMHFEHGCLLHNVTIKWLGRVIMFRPRANFEAK